MRKLSILLASAAGALLLALPAAAEDQHEWNLSGVARIEFDGTSGDVVLLPAASGAARVELTADVEPEDAFRPEVDRRGDVLEIRERWSGSRSTGRVTWRIFLAKAPGQVRFSGSTASGDLQASDLAASIHFRTASGDLELDGVDLEGDSRLRTASGDVELTKMTVVEGVSLNTASGDVRLTDITVGEDVEISTASGDVVLERVTAGKGSRFSTASGSVRARNCRGALHLTSASGDVSVRDCDLTGESGFTSASGDVGVALARMPEVDLLVSSASGDAELGISEWGDRFRLVLVKQRDRGRLACPFPYTSEEEYEEHDHVYVEKTVEQGSGGPEIRVRSSSGDVIVRR